MRELQKYFVEELDYLYHAGKAFSEEYPQLARQLNLESSGDRDPHVDRILEGFAFLTSHIRQKLDDGVPELSESVLETISPEQLMPIPSHCMIAMNPKQGRVTGLHNIPPGQKISSQPMGEELVSSEWRTLHSVDLFPLHIAEVRPMPGNTGIQFKIKFDPAADVSSLTDSVFTMYLDGEQAIVLDLLEKFTQQSVNINCWVNGLAWEFPSNLIPVLKTGWEVPEPVQSGTSEFWKIQNDPLQDYFHFKEKFLFLRFKNLSDIKRAGHIAEFILQLQVPGLKLPQTENLSSHFRLGVTPAVNLFKSTAVPVYLDHRKYEYPVQLAGKHQIICALLDVRGTNKKSGKTTLYQNRVNAPQAMRPCYSYHRVWNSGGPCTGKLSVDLPEEQSELGEQLLSIGVLACDGDFPRKNLAVGDLRCLGETNSNSLQIKNITRPSECLLPPSHKDFQWNALNCLSLNFSSLADISTLEKIMETSNWDPNIRPYPFKILQADLSSSILDLNGSLVPCMELKLTFEDRDFEKPGELNLLGLAFSKYLKRHIGLNYASALIFISQSEKKILKWGVEEGLCHPL